MPLWEKIVIGWLVVDVLTALWFAYDGWMYPVCYDHHNNLNTRRLGFFSKLAWCEKCRITFATR